MKVRQTLQIKKETLLTLFQQYRKSKRSEINLTLMKSNSDAIQCNLTAMLFIPRLKLLQCGFLTKTFCL